MDIRFTWRSDEWREAHLLATATRERPHDGLSLWHVMGVVLVLLGVSDVRQELGYGWGQMLRDSLIPVLLLIVALTLVVAVGVFAIRRHQRLRDLPPLPRGEQQVTLHEFGWRDVAEREEALFGARVHAWSELSAVRTSRRVLTMRMHDGRVVGVPLRAFTPDQSHWIDRLLRRKLPRTV